MVRQIRSLLFIVALVTVAGVIVAIPELKVRLFGGEVVRGHPDTFLGLTLGLDLQGGTHLVYKASTEDGRSPSEEDMQGVRDIIEKRTNEFGVSEPSVQLLGNPPDRVLIQLPGLRGASIQSEISPGKLTEATLLDFLRTTGGHPETTVEVNDLGAFVMRFDGLEGEESDQDGNVITRSEGERLRAALEQAFPTLVTVTYQTTPPATATPVATPAADGTAVATPDPSGTPAATPVATGTPAPDGTPQPTATPAPEFKVPVLGDIVNAVANIGRADAAVTELAPGSFEIRIRGMKDRSTDAEGNIVPSDDENLRDALRALGQVLVFTGQDRILTWTVGGGVQEAKRLIGSTAQLEFRERICGELNSIPEGLSAPEWELVRCQDPRFYTEQPTDIESSDLVDAFAGVQAGVPRPVVNIVFNDKGGDAFFNVTDRISRTGDLLAIYLDDQELVSPRASTGISGGRAFIQGPDFTAERVRTIAIQLRSGALPVSLDLIQERNVDATLGADSLRKTLIAGVVALGIIFAIQIIHYRIPGLVAAVALAIFTLLLLAVFKALPVTMTLAGAAGFILSLGMAEDANVLIAERTKEELRSGRSLLEALSEGFNRSWPSIRDGNIATMLVAAVLFWFGDRFGTSLMQGFALTLGIGTLLSMFTSVTVSRVLLRAIARSPLGKRINLFTPVSDVAHAEEPAAAAGN